MTELYGSLITTARTVTNYKPFQSNNPSINNHITPHSTIVTAFIVPVTCTWR